MRTRAYRRKVRKNKISKRKRQINSLSHLSCFAAGATLPKDFYDSKLLAATYGDKGGLLSKHDLCAIGGICPMKTKTKRIRTHPHRAMGGFGPAYNYSVRDRKQQDSMRDDLLDSPDRDV